MRTESKVRRIAVLWRHVTGYVQAGLRALLASGDVELFVVQLSEQVNAQTDLFSDKRCEFIRLHELPRDDMRWLGKALDFAPSLAIVTGVRDPRYLKAAGQLHRHGTLVVWADDRVLRSPPRDIYQMFLGRVIRLWRDYDAAFVPGHKAAEYAHFIGFPKGRIFQGLYTCDTGLYRPIGSQRHANAHDKLWPKVFLFVGQFIERKGLDILLGAYRRYRSMCHSPWELWCVGAGHLRPMLEAQAGVQVLGFLSPQDCAQAMARSGFLLLPSRWDHWGVVIHEAACAGLPIIASRKCYATVELVQDGYNGFTFPAGDVDYLARLLLICADDQRARQMGVNSLRLSFRFDPQLFAQQVLEHIPSALTST
jgi:glycosyltransferase involved in cell wall biosynthesis